MDLEIRVEALEAEIKVLKNEIQNILLEIQEQILQHYYPSLRVEDSQPSDTLLRALEGIRERKRQADELSDQEDGLAGSVPAARLTSLNDLQRPRPDALASPSADRPAARSAIGADVGKVPPFVDASDPTSSEQEHDEWHSFSEVLSWVQENVGTMGEARVRSVIELYRQEGFITPRVAKALERSIALLA